ncbi:MAG: hypothetical protein P1P90_06770 [Patescibacteria group bacterium]|nr:hypothetical protein [Patescibacteria group bacterium]
MGDLIYLSAYRGKRRAGAQRKQSDGIAVAIEQGKKALPRIKLPPLGEVFVRNLHLRVSDPYALDQFILDLFAEPELPKLDHDDKDAVLNTDYKLQTLAKSPKAPFSYSLYSARLHMEHTLGISMHRLATVRANPSLDRIARVLLGMYSIAWQIKTGQELVLDSKTLASRHGKK